MCAINFWFIYTYIFLITSVILMWWNSFWTDHDMTLLLVEQSSFCMFTYTRVFWATFCLDQDCSTCDCWWMSCWKLVCAPYVILAYLWNDRHGRTACFGNGQNLVKSVNEVNTYICCHHVMHKPVIVSMEDIAGWFWWWWWWGVVCGGLHTIPFVLWFHCDMGGHKC